MKQMIFINTSVQPDRFCFVHLISVKQENWLRGWALSNLQTHQLPGFSCQLQTLDLTHFPKRNMKATPLWHVLSGRLHSTTCLSYGNPAASRQSPAAQWVPSADGLTSEDSHGVTKKEEQDYEWPPGIWDFRGHLQIFQRPDYLHVPSYRALSVQPSSTGSTQTQRRRATRNSYHRSAGLRGHRTYGAGLNMRFLQLPEKFVSTLHMMSRKVQKISPFWRERGRRTLMFKCLTTFFTALN